LNPKPTHHRELHSIPTRRSSDLTSANTKTFLVGTAGTFTVTATGSPAPTLSLTSGTLPSGVTFNATTGILSGTPTTAGTFPLTRSDEHRSDVHSHSNLKCRLLLD